MVSDNGILPTVCINHAAATPAGVWGAYRCSDNCYSDTWAEAYLHTNSTQRVVTDEGVNTSVRVSMTLIYLRFRYYVHWSITSSSQVGREIIFYILVHPEPV